MRLSPTRLGDALPNRAGLAAAALVVASASALVLGACSFGEGFDAECDATAAPGEPDACQQITACDDGNGWILPEPACCTELINREFTRCTGTVADSDPKTPASDFHAQCQANPSEPCCANAENGAQARYQLCLDGNLYGQSGTGGTAGGGGGGGATGGAGAGA